jgi:cell wall-associated NlpC family hydrolase
MKVRRGVALAVVLAALHAPLVSAAPRDAHRSLAGAAGDSMAAAASRLMESTRGVALFALSLVGIEYRYGGDTPGAGLDCSGLIRYVFGQLTGVTLPRTAQEQARLGRRVTLRDLAPGDLVFFNTRHAPNSHVGIYLGDDRFVHAPSQGGEVTVETLSARYWRARYDGARRLAAVLPALVPSFVARAEAATASPPPAATP